jgi:hypothetical protein
METEKPVVSKTDNLKQQVVTDDLNDDASLIFINNDVQTQQHVKDEVLIKRAWSLKDLFKRGSEGKPQTVPRVINQ